MLCVTWHMPQDPFRVTSHDMDRITRDMLRCDIYTAAPQVVNLLSACKKEDTIMVSLYSRTFKCEMSSGCWQIIPKHYNHFLTFCMTLTSDNSSRRKEFYLRNNIIPHLIHLSITYHACTILPTYKHASLLVDCWHRTYWKTRLIAFGMAEKLSDNVIYKTIVGNWYGVQIITYCIVTIHWMVWRITTLKLCLHTMERDYN